MSQKDWILGTDRSAEALERILSTASELVSRNGFQAFTIDALAARLNCSPATIYRRAGGKAAILEALISRFADRITRSVNQELEGLEGTERVMGAVLFGLEHMRAEPLGQLIMGDVRPDRDSGAVTASPLVAKIAEEMIGHDDPLAAQWLIRITFSLWYWPLKDKQTEYELVRRFAAPSVMLGIGDATPTSMA
jgi:AcrR family transcriptional regulator